MVLLHKKHRTQYSRPKRCSQKVLQTRLLYTFPLKMYQYFKYSNSLLFPFDRLSSCFGSLDIRSLGVFTETFLDRYHLDICKSNAKTHKIISINRFGITCCYFSSRNIPAIALFASTFLSNLVLLRSNQFLGLRSGPITLQEITYPDLVVAQTVHYLVFFPCHITKTFNPPDSPSCF